MLYIQWYLVTSKVASAAINVKDGGAILEMDRGLLLMMLFRPVSKRL